MKNCKQRLASTYNDRASSGTTTTLTSTITSSVTSIVTSVSTTTQTAIVSSTQTVTGTTVQPTTITQTTTATQTTTVPTTITQTTTATETTTLTTLVPVGGFVLDQQGRPVQGVRVGCGSGGFVDTDPTGRWALAVRPGPEVILASRSGLIFQPPVAFILATASTQVNFQAMPAQPIPGFAPEAIFVGGLLAPLLILRMRRPAPRRPGSATRLKWKW